ncbi:TolC family protein [Pontiella sulfatireligans]|uniref:Outer membrane efflux protein BepC n=1 Tax=Pontiella sulfatireligans TaxID=2750658 RepID=A0A6C2UJ76_9BACT|nr:TolC family protein [Pontiella sulfatireligans]VGO20275.1 Outer membrane efflux protein BepC [Pontiella sulfatireligans]
MKPVTELISCKKAQRLQKLGRKSFLCPFRSFVAEFSFLFALLAPLLGYSQTNGMALAEVREAVLTSNPSVSEALQRIVAADAVLKQVRSAYLPQVSFNGSYGHVDASLHPDFNPQTRVSDSMKQGAAGLQANWLLFDGFARRAQALAAKYNVQRSQEAADETRRLLILSATVSFRQAQLAAENMKISGQDERFNQTLEEDALKRFNAGTTPEADVFNFSIRALQAESSYLQAQFSYQTACTVLAELMALPEARLSDSMQPASIRFASFHPVPGLEVELQFALRHRPDYKALEYGRLAMAQQVRAAKGGRLPEVSLTGSLDYVDRDGYSTAGRHGNYDSFVGVAAQWDLFTGGRKINEVREAQAELQALEEQRESLRLSIRSELRRRIDEADTARAVFERQEKIYELTTRVRDSVEKSYKAGVASITRLNEAQTDLVRAKGAHARAFIAYQLSLNTLEIETGRILETM